MKLTPVLLTVALAAGTAFAQNAAQSAASARDLATKARSTYPAGSASIDQNLWKQAAAAAEAAVQAHLEAALEARYGFPVPVTLRAPHARSVTYSTDEFPHTSSTPSPDRPTRR